MIKYIVCLVAFINFLGCSFIDKNIDYKENVNITLNKVTYDSGYTNVSFFVENKNEDLLLMDIVITLYMDGKYYTCYKQTSEVIPECTVLKGVDILTKSNVCDNAKIELTNVYKKYN